MEDEWTSVKDDMPPEDTLVYILGVGESEACYYGEKGWTQFGDLDPIGRITHWRHITLQDSVKIEGERK